MESSADVRIIICMPVKHGRPAVPSFVRECDRCHEEVWLSQRYEPEEGDLFRCVHCAVPDIKRPENTVEAAPWTSADFKARLKELLEEQ